MVIKSNPSILPSLFSDIRNTPVNESNTQGIIGKSIAIKKESAC